MKNKKGYKLGEHTTIHNHIHNPENWVITNRHLGIVRADLCPKTYAYNQVVACAKAFLEKEKEKINAYFDEAIASSSEEVLKA